MTLRMSLPALNSSRRQIPKPQATVCTQPGSSHEEQLAPGSGRLWPSLAMQQIVLIALFPEDLSDLVSLKRRGPDLACLLGCSTLASNSSCRC